MSFSLFVSFDAIRTDHVADLEFPRFALVPPYTTQEFEDGDVFFTICILGYGDSERVGDHAWVGRRKG